MTLPIEMQVGELITQSRRAPRGPTAIALAEEAVRLADTARDIPCGMMAREELIRAAAHGGQNDKLLVAFTWCLAQCDQQPDKYNEADFFWQFKWFGEHLGEFPDISRAQVLALFDDMARRYERHGCSIKPVHKLRCQACIHMGDAKAAREWYVKWQATKADWNNDCAACEANSLGTFQLAFGDFAAARRTFKPIVEDGRMRCAEVPHRSYGLMALAFLKNELPTQAQHCQQAGYKLVRSNPDFIAPVGQHMAFATAQGDTQAGLEMFCRHAGWLAHSGSPLEHFEFMLGARAVLAAARAKALGETRKLRLPKELPVYRADGEYKWDDLLAWADSRLNELAAAFDKRNGNDFYSQRVRDARR